MTTRDAATEAQVVAADPGASTWLSANAGSGKTRVLTERVARLLLAGTPPQNILCLTYTKAAAGEMQNRLFKTLGSWAMMPDQGLTAELARIGADGVIPLGEARTLFARAIETPGGLKIQTIHSFCAALLRQFPLEAGVSPGFAEMDESAQRHLLMDVAERLAEDDPEGAVTGFIRHVGGAEIDKLLGGFAGNRGLFRKPMDRAEILASLNAPVGLCEASILEETDPDLGVLAALLPVLKAGSSNDVKAFNKLRGVDGAALSFRTLAVYEDVFLTKASKTDDARSFRAKIGSFPTKASRATLGDATAEALDAFMARVETARDLRLALDAAERTHAMHQFAAHLLPAYEAEKTRRGWLDFDDLIEKAADLLSDRAAADWVLYRLDGGIDHILVDESQDTSPAQWRIIQHLTAEFGAGEGARHGVNRTLFVVGDKKQSIYSFQGADVEAFDQMHGYFAARLGPDGSLRSQDLRHSFRSAPAILGAVDATFAGTGGQGLGHDVQHIAYHSNRAGRVDLWPLVPKPETPEDMPWDVPVDKPSPEQPSAVLARGIAEEITQMIRDPDVVIESGNGSRRLQPGDFLILVRGRQGQGDLFQTLIRALKANGLPVAGADVIRLESELAVRDLRALLSFLALSEDDLSLASALRSPLFGWTEDDLYRLAANRPDKHFLWQALRNTEDHPETLDILRDLLNRADFLRPYDLLERILVRHDGRRKLLARLGVEAEDGIDALLDLALNYERQEIPSLTGFLAWLDGETVEVKRALDQAGGTVRVMTVHGAKGLESPVVILPDTMRPDTARPEQILKDRADRAHWSVAKDAMPAALKDAAEAVAARSAEERQRLLYVAMTRAESWLIVCGFGDDSGAKSSWYGDVEAGLKACGATPLAGRFGEGLRLESGVPSQTAGPTGAPEDAAPPDLPDWAHARAPQPKARETTLSPSDLGGAKALPGEGLSEDEARLFGRQAHLLLEHLPAYPKEAHLEAAVALLAFGEDAAPEDAARAMADMLSPLIQRPDLAHVFAPDTLAEVELAAEIPELDGARIVGVIDRLVVTKNAVTIVDFKTNRVVPATPEAVPEGVLRQMGAYLAAIRQIYPDHAVELQILWTATGVLMPLSHDIVMSALQRTATS